MRIREKGEIVATGVITVDGIIVSDVEIYSR